MKYHFLLIIALAFCLFHISPSHAQEKNTESKLDAAALYEQSVKAVVLIVCMNTDGSLSQGSGVILRSDGVIATNFHVIDDAKSASVKLQNGDVYDDVSIVDTDERKDIAIIKIKATNLPTLSVGNSDTIKVGITIYAIGAPRGLEGSISSGIVSSIRPANEISQTLSGFRVIQITAPISSGSSGGPLLDETGKVIGLVFATRVDAQNINLAIPINYVSPLASNAKNEGRTLAKMNLETLSSISTTSQPQPKPDTVDSIAGTYVGSWASNEYGVSGSLVLTVKVVNGQVQVDAAFTGSDYFNGDTLDAKMTSMGGGVWKMEYKGKKSKITGTGLFKDGTFVGDYRFKKLFWVDKGKWVLRKS